MYSYGGVPGSVYGRDACIVGNETFFGIWQVNIYDASLQKLALNVSVEEPKSKGK